MHRLECVELHHIAHVLIAEAIELEHGAGQARCAEVVQVGAVAMPDGIEAVYQLGQLLEAGRLHQAVHRVAQGAFQGRHEHLDVVLVLRLVGLGGFLGESGHSGLKPAQRWALGAGQIAQAEGRGDEAGVGFEVAVEVSLGVGESIHIEAVGDEQPQVHREAVGADALGAVQPKLELQREPVVHFDAMLNHGPTA